MNEYEENFDELDEAPDEYTDDMILEEKEIPDVYWAEDIEKIENLEIREMEIETARKIQDKQHALEEKLESGEITQDQYEAKYLFELKPEKNRATTRCGLESIDLSYDKLGEVSEEYSIIASGNLKLLENWEKVDDTIDLKGEKAAQGLADKRKDDEEMSDSTHKTISRKVRLHEE